MTIKIGERLPDTHFWVLGNSGPETIPSTKVFDGRTVILIGVPGAFTPTCHRNHLPGYLQHLGEMAEKRVDQVACLAVNDPFVLDHWAEASDAKDKITFLGDADAEFVRAAGLELDASAIGLGVRSQRFALLARDRVVAAIAIEPDPGKVTVSGAAEFLTSI